MKGLIILVCETMFFVVTTKSQHLILAPTIEKTVAGNQYGSQLLFEARSQWSFGGFYQASFERGAEGTQTVNPFYGLAMNAPLVKSDKMNFYFNVRAGVVNQYFLVVVPGLETRLNITRHLCISVVTSVRMTYPSVGAKISIKI